MDAHEFLFTNYDMIREKALFYLIIMLFSNIAYYCGILSDIRSSRRNYIMVP